jgi:PAS domain S-box-containing protein
MIGALADGACAARAKDEMATVLVVDDRPTNRKLVVMLLKRSGHRPLEASDGAEALRLAHIERPELVISDILMPTMDGFEFVRQLRAVPELAETRVIFYTAQYHEREARTLAESSGVSRVLVKPCSPNEILNAIEETLRGERRSPPAPNREFDREHLRLMTDKLAQKVEELTIANKRLDALTDINLQLAAERDPQKLLESVCRDARELVGARYAVLCIHDKSGSHGIFSTTSGIDSSLLDPPRIDDPVLVPTLTLRRSLHIANSGGNPRAAGLPAGYPPVHSALVVPVASLAKTYGWISLLDKLGRDAFDKEDERVLVSLGSQVGRIYENGMLYQEIKHSAENLRESERRYGDMLGTVQLISVMLDRDAAITYCNDHLLRLTGWRREEAIGRNWFEMFVPPELDHDRAVFFDLLQEKDHAWHYEHEILTRGGERLLIRWNNTVLRSTTGDVVGTASIGEDITQRKRAEDEVHRLNADLERRVAERTAELEAANKELEAFDYSISHDLRAPLSRIEGFSAMLREKYGDKLDAHGSDVLQRIAEAGRNMDQLVGDLFALSTATRGELRRSGVNVSTLAQSIVASLRKSEPEREVQFVAPAAMTARADPGLLRVVLENLLGNAWKFTGRRAQAHIEMGILENPGERAYFVRDNGAGFNIAGADELFMPFRRMHARSEFEGTGIGLATVQRIVRRHGGRVWADAAVDQGATFFFTLSV